MNKQYEVKEGVAINKGIGWCTHTASPVKYRDKATGKAPLWACVKISAGCQHWYAESLATRFQGRSFTVQDMATVEPYIDEDELKAILNLKTELTTKVDGKRSVIPWPAPHTRPAIFIEDMSDLWGDWVPFAMIDRVMGVAKARRDLDFIFLTKRVESLVHYFSQPQTKDSIQYQGIESAGFMIRGEEDLAEDYPSHVFNLEFPLPNVILMFSAEDQPNFDARWAHMRKLAAMGWMGCRVGVSIEPQIGPVDIGWAIDGGLECTCCPWRGHEDIAQLSYGLKPDEEEIYTCPSCREECAHVPSDEMLESVIIGGESGHGARPWNVQWGADLLAQCEAAGVPAWMKQYGANPVIITGNSKIGGNNAIEYFCEDSHGADWNEWDPAMRVRQLPEMR